MDELLDPKDVRRILKVSLPLVYKLAHQGRLSCVRIACPGEGKKARSLLRFKLNDVQAFIEANYRPQLD
jgi:hypothetical protein